MICENCIHKQVCFLEPEVEYGEGNCEYYHGTCEDCIEFSNYYCVQRAIIVAHNDYCMRWKEKEE